MKLQKSEIKNSDDNKRGKTKVAKNLFVFRPYDFIQKNPEMGIKLTTLYFALEEPKREFIQSAISYRLRKDHNVRKSIDELNSILDPDNPTSVIDQDIIDKTEGMESYFEEFEKNVIVYDDIYNPYGIYRTCVDFLETIGDYHMIQKKVYDPVAKESKNKLVKGPYVADDPNHYVQIVIDHFSLIHPEKGDDLFEAIRKLSSNYLVPLKNKYGCHIVAVQQQAADKEKQQYTYKGASIESKLEPSLDGLADCKLTQRDATLVLGVFAPDRYEITNHRGYDIASLRDNYRGLSILKNRHGPSGMRLGVLFDGATDSLWELKKPGDMLPSNYKTCLETVGRSV